MLLLLLYSSSDEVKEKAKQEGNKCDRKVFLLQHSKLNTYLKHQPPCVKNRWTAMKIRYIWRVEEFSLKVFRFLIVFLLLVNLKCLVFVADGKQQQQQQKSQFISLKLYIYHLFSLQPQKYSYSHNNYNTKSVSQFCQKHMFVHVKLVKPTMNEEAGWK